MMIAVPPLLVVLGFFAVGTDAGVTSGTAPDNLLLMYAVVPVIAAVAVPLLRRRPLEKWLDARSADAGLPAALMTRTIAEYAFWEAPSLMGFIALLDGASWAYFLAMVVFSLIGYAISFPRRSAWQEAVESHSSVITST